MSVTDTWRPKRPGSVCATVHQLPGLACAAQVARKLVFGSVTETMDPAPINIILKCAADTPLKDDGAFEVVECGSANGLEEGEASDGDVAAASVFAGGNPTGLAAELVVRDTGRLPVF